MLKRDYTYESLRPGMAFISHNSDITYIVIAVHPLLKRKFRLMLASTDLSGKMNVHVYDHYRDSNAFLPRSDWLALHQE